MGEYIPDMNIRGLVMSPFLQTHTEGLFDVAAQVHGGGVAGQAGGVAGPTTPPTFNILLLRRVSLPPPPPCDCMGFTPKESHAPISVERLFSKSLLPPPPPPRVCRSFTLKVSHTPISGRVLALTDPPARRRRCGTASRARCSCTSRSSARRSRERAC